MCTAKLLEQLRKKVVEGLPSKVAGLFVLDPLLQIMPDTTSIFEKRKNWHFIEKEMTKFGIEFEADTKTSLIVGNHRCIIEFMEFLVDFEKAGGCASIGNLLLTMAIQQVVPPS